MCSDYWFKNQGAVPPASKIHLGLAPPLRKFEICPYINNENFIQHLYI